MLFCDEITRLKTIWMELLMDVLFGGCCKKREEEGEAKRFLYAESKRCNQPACASRIEEE